MDNETREKASKWAASNGVGGKDLTKVAVVKASPVTQISGVAPSGTVALKIAVKIIKPYEGFSAFAYPDPMSPLSLELAKHNILKKFILGQIELPPYLRKLSGFPFTIGYGRTEGVKEGDVTDEATEAAHLEKGVAARMQAILKATPKLKELSPEAIAACVSLAYNIGTSAFNSSTVARCITNGSIQAAGDAFLLFDNAQGVKDVPGLQARRKSERSLFLSVSG